jgi:hypothetical protein
VEVYCKESYIHPVEVYCNVFQYSSCGGVL